jgi:hypothetical protein
MPEANVRLHHEIFFGNVRHFVDEVFNFLADVQRDVVSAILLVVLRSYPAFQHVA